MKCFFHSADLDGHCSGALIKLRYPECEMIGIDYGDLFPWDSIRTDEKIFVVDFCLQPFSEMVQLNSVASLVWIDHHKTAIEASLRGGVLIKGIRRNGTAACELTWEFLYPNWDCPEDVHLLGCYDVWKMEDERVLPYQYGCRLHETNPGTEEGMKFWEDSQERSSLASIVHDGRIVLRYQEQQSKTVAKNSSFLAEFEGLRFLVCNTTIGCSSLYDSVYDPDKHDAMLTFRMGADQKWLMSLRSRKPEIDVSKICQKYGGGGHKAAAGFECVGISFSSCGELIVE